MTTMSISARDFVALTTSSWQSDNIELEWLAALHELQYLRDLSVRGGRVNGQLVAALKELKHFRGLYVDHAVSEDDSFESLDSLPYLTELSFRQMNLATANLESLSRCFTIKNIDLSDSIMPPSFVSHLRSMRSLKRINVQGTNLSESDVQALKMALPLLQIEGEPSPHSASSDTTNETGRTSQRGSNRDNAR